MATTMVDEHQHIVISDKLAQVGNIGVIVSGETNSNILTFEIDRYYDGVDLYTKNIRFIVKNSNGVFTEDIADKQEDGDILKFTWILSYAVTQRSELVTVAIDFYGIENGEYYSLKTLPFTIDVKNTLDFADVSILPPENWFVKTENRLEALENGQVNTDTTLTKSNIPADAKAVGDKFKDYATTAYVDASIANSISGIQFETTPIDFSTVVFP